ncbi:hypothetical protein BJ875DRAFT_451250 [Amylocarpus encephaloides]|uniref:MYND-type domain-containing protein n=1 Tax=Amylocarpus encephaloides TaxID=45428 RepID=A0A9P7YSB2_9HELO|nr:hypothetical protein BJ875DRAFT_451250 [Amylocarpus encephaloides]
MHRLAPNPRQCPHPAHVRARLRLLHDGRPAPARPYGIPAAKFDDEFGSLIQFVSTIFLYGAEMESVHPRVVELIPKLKSWKQTYRNSTTKTISRASERLVDQIQGMNETMVAMVTMMRRMQEQSSVCGVRGCGVQGAMETTLCGTCRVQRYCGREHQRADWRYHKHICAKGLVEPVRE